MSSNVDPVIRKYMSDLGRKGRGASKRRGNRKYYQELARKRWAKRKKNEQAGQDSVRGA